MYFVEWMNQLSLNIPTVSQWFACVSNQHLEAEMKFIKPFICLERTLPKRGIEKAFRALEMKHCVYVCVLC